MKPFHLHLLCIPLALLSFVLVWRNLPDPRIEGRILAADKVVVVREESAFATHPAELAILKGMFVGEKGAWMRCGGGQLAFYHGADHLETVDFQVSKRSDGVFLNLLYRQWGKPVVLRSNSRAAAALIAQLAAGKCDCESPHLSVFAAR